MSVRSSKVRSRVPQGSVLRPLFFLLFISNLGDSTLPKATSFQKDVTLDLKEFGAKWIVDSFTRFTQEKLISNKKADTIINAVNDYWCMSVRFPFICFFTDNSGEFSNIKLEELTSKFGLTVKVGPSYSPWSNRINERNHASADLTIKKLMKEHKTPLMDSLVKATT